MRRTYAFLLFLVLAASGCRNASQAPPAAASSPAATLLSRDEALLKEFDEKKKAMQDGSLTKEQYADALRDLRKRELALFEEVKNTKFEDMLEHNYWHRGRLKFPGQIEMELQRLQ